MDTSGVQIASLCAPHARRVTETAAQLVVKLLPRQPVRQWLLRVPCKQRFLVCQPARRHGPYAGHSSPRRRLEPDTQIGILTYHRRYGAIYRETVSSKRTRPGSPPGWHVKSCTHRRSGNTPMLGCSHTRYAGLSERKRAMSEVIQPSSWSIRSNQCAFRPPYDMMTMSIIAKRRPSMSRYGNATEQKASGSTYTPPELAAFVAEQMLGAADFPASGPIRIFDPAVGDGALLNALIGQIPKTLHKRLEVVGFDTNEGALEKTRSNLTQSFPELNLELRALDFLNHALEKSAPPDLFREESGTRPFHLIIANPPYVRTQILGAEVAQKISRDFGLSGRIDLYYPFLLALADYLKGDGVMGIITSNRFMSTKSGEAIRQEVLSRFSLVAVFDLGDTKLFDAAVLPAVLIAGRGSTDPLIDAVPFCSTYETKERGINMPGGVLSALQSRESGAITLSSGLSYQINVGNLNNGGSPRGVWRVANERSEAWLDQIANERWATFGEVFNIRVGVKTTADKVFIHSQKQWDEMPEGRPELLRPLETRHRAGCFRAAPLPEEADRRYILYPHESTPSGKAAVNLNDFPVSKRYLERFRERLEGRKYVIAAGRKWYEIWVPQDPSAWQNPKLVWPDISDKPRFWMDQDGSIVNGECYWLQMNRGSNEDVLWLALAVANSSFIEKFYDRRFNNKLYAGRRRYITQYVEQFPLPNPHSAIGEELISLAKKAFDATDAGDRHQLHSEVNARVWTAFGLSA
jgi:adenine-specific DNA-methyltransferase